MASCGAFLMLLQWVLAVELTSAGQPNPSKFLIVSAPRDGQIAYARIEKGGRIAAVDTRAEAALKPLISSGLVHPQGLAVNQQSKQLLVADPDSKSIYAYPLSSYEATLSVGERTVLADNTEARWVAVDGMGNIYFSDEPKNQILKISRAQALRSSPKPQVVFDGSSMPQVSSPGGVAADSFHTFWVNKQAGKQVGSVIASPNAAEVNQLPVALANNTEKSYGLCLAYNNIFYTQPESTIFGVKKTGSAAVAITNRMTNPRGCAWDGDGTVYVADRGANAVYSFAANMNRLGAIDIAKAVDFEDAFGVAVFSGAQRASLLCVLLATLVVALA